MVIDQPLVSVIIPVYNGRKYLAEAVESVRKQNYRPMEIIIIDDGSTDDTEKITRGLGPDIHYLFQQNAGPASARNTGIVASRGEIIAFLDSDDVWPHDRLTITTGYLKTHPEVGYLLGRQMMFLERGCAVPPWMKAVCLSEPQDASNLGVLTARRMTFDRVGLFSNKYRSGEDTEWLLRANEAGVPMARLPEIVVHRRIHGRNLSIQTIQMRKKNLMRMTRESIHRKQRRSGVGRNY
jgi:glycosyltransferase involved in cell wall biosynthesis